MANGNGLMEKFLLVDMNTNTINVEDKYVELTKKYLGGSGIGSKIIWDHIKELEKKGINIAEMDALAPENIIIIATGPGTSISGFPSSGRHHIMAMKSPLTGSIASANSGGKWGAYLKKAGADGIILKGKASKPMYLTLLDGKFELHDASNLWGKDIFETTKILEEKYKKSSVMCVSQLAEAGNNLTGIMNDSHRACGRTGVGAIMASKNLKAIVVAGKQKIQIANNKKFKKVSKECLKKLKENPLTGSGLPTYGTALLVNVINGIGSLPQNNWQSGQNEKSDKLSGETLTKDYLRSKHPCWGCTIAYGRKTKVDSGPYAIANTEGPEYETIWAFGNSCGVYDLKPVIMANHLCDQYGIDTISMGSTIACAMELNEKGFIPEADLDGIDMKFGNGAALVESLKLAGQNKGFGKKLLKGSKWLAANYGHPEFSMTCRALEMPAYDPRGIKGIGLNYATSNRGGCHVTGYTIAPEVAGLPEQIDRLAYDGKPTWVKIFQDFTVGVNSTVNCLFTTFALGAGDFANLLSAVTGWDIDDAKFLQIGERTYNLQRLIMKKLDIQKDTLPDRLLKTPLPDGVSKDEICELDKMLGKYYELRGWDADGYPTAEKIKELDIE